MEDLKFCQNPWNCFEINNDGRCFFCNPCFSNFNAIGNLFEDDIDTIWNGEKAQNYRKDVLEKNIPTAITITATAEKRIQFLLTA